MDIGRIAMHEFEGSERLLKALDEGDIGELARAIGQGYDQGGYASGGEYMQVVRMLRLIESADDNKGAYTVKCREMAIRLLETLPDTEPDTGHEINLNVLGEGNEGLYLRRLYVQNLVQFCGYLGKDAALFESLYGLINSPKMKADIAGTSISAHLARSLSAVQTDRRLQPTWEDMLNEAGERSEGSFYREPLEGGLYEGYRGLCQLPPESGDAGYAGLIPAGAFEHATGRLVQMLDSNHDNGFPRGELGKASMVMDELFFLSRGYTQELVGQVICGMEKTEWPGWAKRVAAAIESNGYALLEPAHIELALYTAATAGK
ncbi:hypothetical protein HYV82_03615 [Candidatus Woesearchaeota archaeon]|nr:hypothetical protein [Candidatus Woesearchaeota archaeon]